MKLALFSEPAESVVRPGVITDAGVVDASSVVASARTPQRTIEFIIDNFESLRPAIERIALEHPARRLYEVRLHPPTPRPTKVMCCIANYWEHAQREARPLNMFLKNPDDPDP